MFNHLRDALLHRIAAIRARGNQRLTGAVLALLVEALLILAVLSIGFTDQHPVKPGSTLVSVNIAAAPDQAPQKPAAKPDAARRPSVQQPPQAAQPAPQPPVVQPAAPQVPAIIPLSKNEMAAFDIARIPRQAAAAVAPGKAAMGPPDTGVPGDSKRVGSAPNGEPMYAAAWYREPYDSELRGYLSTADGPGWALIACRTVADFKVDDCVGIDEYPLGSNMLRAVLAAAWQFKVRPPRVGGVSRVGEWVRIRIEYSDRSK